MKSIQTTVVSCKLAPFNRVVVTTKSNHHFCAPRSERHIFHPGVPVVYDDEGWRPAEVGGGSRSDP